MTTLGKVLAFVLFVFAMLASGLIIMVFLTTTNWRKGVEDRDVIIKQERAESLLLRDEIKKLIGQRDAAEAQVATEKAARDAQQKKDATDLSSLKDLLDKEIANRKQADADAIEAVAAKKGLEDEVKTLRTIIADRETRITTYTKDVDKYRNDSVRAQIELNSMKQRADGLAEQIEFMARELEKSKARNGTASYAAITPNGTGAPRIEEKSPPSDDVEGLVKETDAKTGLVVISIGSDAGISVNNTLEVFRMSPPTYLGTMRIVDVRHHEAVGRMVNGYNNRREQVKAGDTVASQILGGQRR
jgi:hypothetical protein